VHDNSFHVMRRILAALEAPLPFRVLDVGSRVYLGARSYRDALPTPAWDYVGMDLEPGENVDVVLEDIRSWPFDDASFNAVISGQCIEHAEDLPVFFREVGRVLAPGGTAVIIAPWCWDIHRVPVDCWRILPDGMRFLLAAYAGLRVLNTWTVDVRLENSADTTGLPAGDLLVTRPGSDAPPVRLADVVLGGDNRLGDVVVQGDCVGVGVKVAAD
jgi:SAM-dependent methyltransferase